MVHKAPIFDGIFGFKRMLEARRDAAAPSAVASRSKCR
jgi:hypothetical protein